MKKKLKRASSAVALVPGLAIILTGLLVPPGMSKYLLGGFVEAICGLTLFIFSKKRKKTKLLPSTQRTVSISFLVVCILAFFSYWYLYSVQVVYNSKYDVSVLFPFWSNGDLQYMIKNAGSKNNAITTYGLEAVQNSIRNTPSSLYWTENCFFLLYMSIFEFLTLGFGIITFDNKLG